MLRLKNSKVRLIIKASMIMFQKYCADIFLSIFFQKEKLEHMKWLQDVFSVEANMEKV